MLQGEEQPPALLLCALLRRFSKGTRSMEGFAEHLQRRAPACRAEVSLSPQQAWLAGNWLFPCSPQPPAAAPLGFSARHPLQDQAHVSPSLLPFS